MEMENNTQSWVWLTKGAYRTVIDRREVSSVCDSIGGGCAISLRGSDYSLRVDGTIEEVSKKLGIPIEGLLSENLECA